MRTLAELHAAFEAKHFAIKPEIRWELCSSCPVIPCDPKAKRCACRRWWNARQKEYRDRYYAKESAAERRKKLPPEKRQKILDAQRRYYREAADVEKVKSRAYYYAHHEAVLKQKRQYHARKRRQRLKQLSSAVPAVCETCD